MDQEHAQGCGAALGRTRNASAWISGGIKQKKREDKASGQGWTLCAQAEGIPGHKRSGSAHTWHSWAPEPWNNDIKQGTEIITETFPH